MAEDFIPDDQFIPDQDPKAAPDFVPDHQFKPDQLKASADFVPDEQFIPDEDKYSTTGQQLGTVAEGLSQGFAGPVATYAEQKLNEMGVPNLTPEDIKGRAEANPGLHLASEAAGLIGGMTSGVGEAGLIAKGLKGLEVAREAPALSKVGSAAIRGAISMGLIQGGDELSKSMLGQGDPEHPVSAALANMGASALLGGITGGVIGGAGAGTSKGLQAIEENKLGTKLQSFMAGVGHSASFPGTGMPSEEVAMKQLATIPEEFHGPSFKLGQKTWEHLAGKVVKQAARSGAGWIGGAIAGVPGAIAAPIVEQNLEKLVGPLTTKASQKVLGPMILKAASSGSVSKLGQMMDYANSVSSGEKAINKGVDALFQSGGHEALNYSISDKDRDKLKEFIENGGVDQQLRDQQQTQMPTYAEGGEVHPIQELNEHSALATHWPEQNVLLNSARARISNHLNSVRPHPNPIKLPYDSDRKNPADEREYNKVVDLALKPMSILKKIKNGRLVPKDMAHFSSMYPELHKHLSDKITKKMVQDHHIDENKRPPYHIRQAISLFMGSSLDSTLTPAGIQAAQSVFINQNNQKAAQMRSASLGKASKVSQTLEQGRESRGNKS